MFTFFLLLPLFISATENKVLHKLEPGETHSQLLRRVSSGRLPFPLVQFETDLQMKRKEKGLRTNFGAAVRAEEDVKEEERRKQEEKLFYQSLDLVSNTVSSVSSIAEITLEQLPVVQTLTDLSAALTTGSSANNVESVEADVTVLATVAQINANEPILLENLAQPILNTVENVSELLVTPTNDIEAEDTKDTDPNVPLLYGLTRPILGTTEDIVGEGLVPLVDNVLSETTELLSETTESVDSATHGVQDGATNLLQIVGGTSNSLVMSLLGLLASGFIDFIVVSLFLLSLLAYFLLNFFHHQLSNIF